MESFFNFVLLEITIRYTLGKGERLKSRKAIDCLFKEGQSFTIFPFRIVYILEEMANIIPSTCSAILKPNNLQAGFTVSSRNFKRAVDRNRIRRQMKEAYRLQKNELQQLIEIHHQHLTLFFIFIGKELPDFNVVFEKTSLVLTRLIKLTRENK